MKRYGSAIRPAGESSDEDDELSDYVSNKDNGPTRKTISTVNVQLREDERIFGLFLGEKLAEIKTLLDEGFDVNSRLREDWTPLLLAASIGSHEITAELISRGADVNAHRDYYTPLMAAAACPISTSPYERSLLVIKQLLERKVNTNAKTRKRITALMFAASSGNCAIVKELLPLSDKAAEDNQGWTALFWAVSSNSIEVVKLLLDEGFACNKFDVRGNLPMHYAQENDFIEIMEILPALKTVEAETYVHDKYGHQDFFDNGRSDFVEDILLMLYGMKNERNIEHFLRDKITLFEFLTLNEEDLKRVNIKMPYERYRILSGLYRFHNCPYKTKSLPIVGKSESYSTINAANTILSACRQFVAMQASLRYILKNSNNLSELRDFNKEVERIKDCLNKIKHVITKINKQALEWDIQNKSADLITKDSYRRLKSSKLKYFCVFNILAVIMYFTWKTTK